MRRTVMATSFLLIASLFARADAGGPPKATQWDAAAAARYLDGRLAWWRQWPKAERDHGTRCVSCHTSLPHTLAMPALRAQTGTSRMGVDEIAMFDDVVKRVYLWNEVAPFYPDQTRGVPKSAESRGVESVLNALILATRDQERGHLGPDTRQAFANMWSQQMQTGDAKGGFTWLNFRLEPFESSTAPYWGAALAALALKRAPGDYVADPAIKPQVDALRAFLRTGTHGSLFTRALILLADSHLHDVLNTAEREGITADLIAAQSADGGWSLVALSDWRRVDGTDLPRTSDGFATATLALVLREAGVSPATKPLKMARLWLARHQDKQNGAVPAKSINKDRNPSTDAYLFMTDSATGMAALAMRPD